MAIVFDTETTGLISPTMILEDQPFMIEIFALKIDDKTLEETDSFKRILNPGVKLKPIITKITGLTDKDLADEPRFSKIYRDLCEFFCGERVAVAHNFPFDRDIVHFELQRLGREKAFPWPFYQVCTIEHSMHIRGHRMKLQDLYTHFFGEKFSGAHRAEEDVRALHAIYRHMIQSGIVDVPPHNQNGVQLSDGLRQAN